AWVVGGEWVFGWLHTDDVKIKVVKLLAEEVLPILVVLSVWALGWALASRIAQGAFRYVTHLTLAAFAFGATRWMGSALIPALGFWSALSPTPLRLAAELVGLGMGAWLIAQHLFRIGSWSLRRCYVVASSLMLAMGLVAELK